MCRDCTGGTRRPDTPKSPAWSDGPEVQAPVVTAHEGPRRVLELVFPSELEAELAADRVRRGVLDRRVRVEEPVLPIGARALDREGGSSRADPSALEFPHDHPADLVDLVVQ